MTYHAVMGRNRGFDETTVLDVVRDRFWTTGFDGTSTYDLMEATGLGKGTGRTSRTQSLPRSVPS